MTAAEAVLLPAPAPDEAPRRHLDIAPTRAQKRARPRIYGAIIAIAGIGVVLLAQLMMSIVVADGAYQIAALQTEKRDIIREQHAASETLQQMSSTQSLMQNASALGMVVSGNPIFLDIASGQALGVAADPKGQIVGSAGNLIGNALLADGATMLDPNLLTGAENTAAVSPTAPVGGTQGTGVAPVPTTPGTLPSPTTR